MADFPIDKIQITGATLASLLLRSSTSSGDIHGYLFGLTDLSSPNPLSDHHTTTTTTHLTATITSFLSLPSHFPLPPPPPPSESAVLLGFFSSRRKTQLRPSFRDSTTALSLSHTPSLFILFTTPFQDQSIHTHEYKAFQHKGSTFEPKSLNIINLGPSFRSHYDSFTPNVAFPMMDCELRGSGSNSTAMIEDGNGENLANMKRNLRDQKQLDTCADGFEVSRLSKLMGSGSANTGVLEDLYDTMLAKIDGLTKMVEQSNAKLLEQENHNMKLRYKVAGLE